MLFRLLRPFLYCLSAERAHRMAIAALKTLPTGRPAPGGGPLATSVAGLAFPNPVGMAAGFDKDGEVPDALLGLGFGFAEVGSITPLPQAGNPLPRLFRLTEDRAVINRMGFNNGGAQAAAARLAARKGYGGIVGINIGANKDSPDRIADYALGVATMLAVADYLTINISSPNTPGLRALQDPQALAALLQAVMEARGAGPPLFLKVAPDLQPADIDAIARLAIDHGVDALIVSNTTIARPEMLSPHAGESGGLSGAPLRMLALRRLADFRTATGGRLPLIAAGGIASAEHAYASIRTGASLVQLYSALVYEGPGLAKRIVAGLKELVVRDGFTSIEQAIGA